ncbi:toxin C-terminal domain-containing protein [Nocardia sp. NPDC004168]|uniref:toxin C-terminal domain-containing protein n=1 Tax=Nocardia TaxID=1817 RepID=UPI0033B9629E
MTTFRTSATAALFATWSLIAVASAQAVAAPLEDTTSPATAVIFQGDAPAAPSGFEFAAKRFTDSEDRAAARDLGYAEAKVGRSHGCLIFKHAKKNLYISQDVDGHNGGRWKMASSPERLASKDTRMGTYDENLNRIGD